MIDWMLRIESKGLLGVEINRNTVKSFWLESCWKAVFASVDIEPGELVRNGLVNSSVLQNGEQWYFRKDTDNLEREDEAYQSYVIVLGGGWVGTSVFYLQIPPSWVVVEI